MSKLWAGRRNDPGEDVNQRRPLDQPVIDRLVRDEIVDVDPAAAVRIRCLAERVADGSRGMVPLAEVVDAAAELVTVLPASLVGALYRFRNFGSTHNVLLVRGLLADLDGLGPSPGTSTPGSADPVANSTAVTLLAVSAVLGEPFTFASLYEGRLIQHVTPVRGQEDAQTSEGSGNVLAWHVEDAFTDERCDFFGLLCLRGAPDAVTLLAPARSLVLPAEVERVLREPRFVVAPDVAHLSGLDAATPHPGHGLVDGGAAPARAVRRAPVLTGPADDPEICFDAVYQCPGDPDDAEAADALAVLARAIDSVVVGHVLEPGQLLIADNRRVVHGRTLFQPRYDGTDRWLLRAMVCSDIRAHRRRGSVRTLS
jgi:L-asparagine oxygenase